MAKNKTIEIAQHEINPSEGVERHARYPKYFRSYDEKSGVQSSKIFENPIQSYKSLWESINGAGSWDENPLVWVIEFEVIQ